MLFDSGSYVFVGIHDRKQGEPFTVMGTLKEQRDLLRTWEQRGYGVFACVNESRNRSRKTRDILRVRALFIDYDDKNEKREFNYDLEPSLIVETSPGKHHVYWYGEVDTTKFTAYQKILISRFGSDDKICDLSRIMRVPGFLHQKAEPFMVRVIGGNERVYSELDLTEFVKGSEGVCDIDVDAMAVFRESLDNIALAKPGNRNATLFKEVVRIGELVKAGRIDKDISLARILESANLCGLESAEIDATIRSAANTAKPVKANGDLFKVIKTEEVTSTRDRLIVASSEVRPIDWVWDGWLAKGAMHIIGGSPSTGKTTVAIALGAIISTGGYFPDGSVAEKQHVVMWSGEDDAETTLNARFLAAGADMSHVHIVKNVRKAMSDVEVEFDPAADFMPLRDFIESLGKNKIGLLIIDPIISAVTGDSHKNSDVRRGLQPYVNLGFLVNAPVLGITHMTKGSQGRDPVERITGSIAFSALARIIYICVRDETSQGTERHFIKAKSNISDEKGSFSYTLEVVRGLPGNPRVVTTYAAFGPANNAITARDKLALAEASPDDRANMMSAASFLLEEMEDGDRSADAINQAAKKLGISASEIRRTAQALGYKYIKKGVSYYYAKQ